MGIMTSDHGTIGSSVTLFAFLFVVFKSHRRGSEKSAYPIRRIFFKVVRVLIEDIVLLLLFYSSHHDPLMACAISVYILSNLSSQRGVFFYSIL
ncbi:hypothetical protein Bca4012_037612 [Brassica carinata]